MNDKEVKFLLLPEEKYIQYNNKVYIEQLIIKNLLFDEPMFSGRESETFLFCECYSVLSQIKELLNDIKETFDTENCEFYVNERQIFKASILLSSLWLVKDELLKNNISTSIH